jgi:aminocarboxymuconate-semialdehyde decarboxylase
MIVDTHAHFVPSQSIETLRAEPRLFRSVKLIERDAKVRLAFNDQQPSRPMSPRLSDVAHRKTWLGAQCIDHQVIGSWLDIFGYELPPDEGAEWCRFLNDGLLKAGRDIAFFSPLACVPMQSGKHAAKVLEEALAAGFHGVMIGTQPKGVGGNLDDPDLDPFWQLASDQQVTVFVHPMVACCDDRLEGYNLVNCVGRIGDTTTAIARLLFSGHIQRFPGVNLVIAHGGAALPFMLGRLRANHARHRDECADPVEAFHRLYFDTVLYDTPALNYLREVAGADRLMLGSDSPFIDADPMPFVNDMRLSDSERRAILGENAVRLFHIHQHAVERGDGQNAKTGPCPAILPAENANPTAALRP